MQNWSLDKQDLIGKREALSTRLEETKAQVEKMLAEAQKAAKTLVVAQEHQRRQELIMTALKNELKTVDAHVAEADREFANAERSAVWLATERLQEEWDAAAVKLVEVGAKLYAGKSYTGSEGMAFTGLMIRSELDWNKTWARTELIHLSHQLTPSQIIELQPDSPAEVNKAA